MTAITTTRGTSSIAVDPVLPLSRGRKLFMPSGTDSSGGRYIDDRSTVQTRPFQATLPVVEQAELIALRTALSGGPADIVTWDCSAESSSRSLRLESWGYLPLYPGKYRVTINATELL